MGTVSSPGMNGWLDTGLNCGIAAAAAGAAFFTGGAAAPLAIGTGVNCAQKVVAEATSKSGTSTQGNPLMEAQLREAQQIALDKKKRQERTAWVAVGVGAGAIVLGTIAYFALKGK